MLLSEARTRVLSRIDDDTTRFDQTEIDAALQTALDVVCKRYAARGGSGLDEILDTQAIDGYCDLTAKQPLIVHTVQLRDAILTPIAAVRSDQIYQNLSGTQNIKVRFIRRATMPSTANGQFLYGPGLQHTTIDELVCIQACRLLLPKDYEQNPNLETNYQELMQDLLSDEIEMVAMDMPYRTLTGFYDYGWYHLPHGVHLGLMRG